MIRENLLNIFCVSGQEEAMARYIQSEIGWCFDEVTTDKLGNLIFHKIGSEKRIIFACHMDKSGLVVTYADKDKVKIAPLGNIDVYSAAYCRVRSQNGYTGILIPPAEINADTKLSDFTADFFGSNENLSSGDKLEFLEPFCNIGENHTCCTGAGTLAVLQSMIDAAGSVRSSDCDVYFVFTTMGNVGGRNMSQAVYGIDADFAVFAGVCEDEKLDKTALLCMTKNFTPTPCAVDYARQKLDKANINYFSIAQPKLISEAAFLQNSTKGTPTVEVCINAKRMGTSGESVNSDGIRGLTEALIALL